MATRRLVLNLEQDLYDQILRAAVSRKAHDDAARAAEASMRNASGKPLLRVAWAQGPGRQVVAANFDEVVRGRVSIEEGNRRTAEAYKAYRQSFKRPPGRPRTSTRAKPLWMYVQLIIAERLAAYQQLAETVA